MGERWTIGSRTGYADGYRNDPELPQNVGRQDSQTLRSRILSRRVFRRASSVIIKSLARRWRRRWTIGSRTGYADGYRNDPELPAKRLKPEEERAGLGCAEGCLRDVSSVAATALRGGEIQRAPASRTGGRRARPFLRPAVFSFRNRKTVRVRGAGCLAEPVPARVRGGFPGTGASCRRKIRHERPTEFPEKESVGGFTILRRFPNRARAMPDFVFCLSEPGAATISSVAGRSCADASERLTRHLVFRRFLQKAFRPLMPNGFRTGGDGFGVAACFPKTDAAPSSVSAPPYRAFRKTGAVSYFFTKGVLTTWARMGFSRITTAISVPGAAWAASTYPMPIPFFSVGDIVPDVTVPIGVPSAATRA